LLVSTLDLASIFHCYSQCYVSALSGFDERLPEDPKVNRLEDSFLFWRMICRSSRLLKPSGLMLFLTGCDVLRDKLKRGVQVKDTVPSYGDRPNDPDVVVKCEFMFFVVVSIPLSLKYRFQGNLQADRSAKFT
jgi:hypothetical protein